MSEQKRIRIIGGTYRGRKLFSPKGMETRPTPDRVREALFNILGPSVVGCRFMDLFSGTGAVGLEAVSRGATRVTLVEKSPQAIQNLKRNLRQLGCDSCVRLWTEDVYRITDFAQEDFIFTSPPYPEIDRIPKLGINLVQHASDTVWWILQHPKSFNLSRLEEYWEVGESRKYGINFLTFFKKRKEVVAD